MFNITHTAYRDIRIVDPDFFQKFFSDVNSIDTLIKSINKYSKDYKKYYYDDEKKMLGDLFEIFVEGMFYLLSSDNRFNFYNYSVVPPEDDRGVDGICLYGNGDKNTSVQIKFRNDPTHLLDNGPEGLREFGMYGNNKKFGSTYFLVITTCAGIRLDVMKKSFGNDIKCFGYNELKNITTCKGFWYNLKKLIK